MQHRQQPQQPHLGMNIGQHPQSMANTSGVPSQQQQQQQHPGGPPSHMFGHPLGMGSPHPHMVSAMAMQQQQQQLMQGRAGVSSGGASGVVGNGMSASGGSSNVVGSGALGHGKSLCLCYDSMSLVHDALC